MTGMVCVTTPQMDTRPGFPGSGHLDPSIYSFDLEYSAKAVFEKPMADKKTTIIKNDFKKYFIMSDLL